MKIWHKLYALVGVMLAASCAQLQVAPTDPNETISSTVVDVAQNIVSSQIAYSSIPSNLADCSGIFLRASEQLGSRCVGLNYPSPSQARSTADIAQWFASQGQFMAVNSLSDIDSLLQPGDVVFYSTRSQRGSSVSFRDYDHMGIVVGLTRNSQYQITGYRLLQGRKPGTRAQVSSYHKRATNNDRPLGNGNQYLVGIAKLCRGSTCTCEGDNLAGMLESKPVEPSEPAAVAVAKAEPAAAEEPKPVKVSTGDIGSEVKLPNGKRKKVLKVLKGGASYYAEYFHGRLTANGERFDMNAMTAAHKTLPFGTWVRVRRTDTGKSVIVRINDRGPFIKGRIIDLSKEAGRRLGLMKIGVAKVEVDVLG